jgi:aspartate ammonia-lyase
MTIDETGAFGSSVSTYLPKPGGPTRRESDSLGSVDVPADAYWGVHTARALSNFRVSGRPIGEFPDLIRAYALVKLASARANVEIGSLDPEVARHIEAAALELADGALIEEFVVDILQGGAGTSTNMNVNEVLANRALELAGYPKGDYAHIDPLDHVNRAQSTNDTYPTALKLALVFGVHRLLDELTSIGAAFKAKSEEFTGIVKVGRTQLQDAVPMTLQQEFEDFSLTFADDHERLQAVVASLCNISLGATAIGTGITADPDYADAACRHLAELTQLPLRTSKHLVYATTDMGVFMHLSGSLKALAMRLSKICNDLRLLSSGPQAGLGEIRLPPRQAGSSIMPGKVNPVIPESVNQVCFLVAGADLVVSMASEAGQLQLNAFEPVMAASLLQSLKYLTAGLITLRVNCVDGIEANTERLAQTTSSFVGTITAFTPYIGYAKAAQLAKRALADGADIVELIVAEGLMDRDDVLVLMEPARLSGIDRSEPPLSRHYGASHPAIRE